MSSASAAAGRAADSKWADQCAVADCVEYWLYPSEDNSSTSQSLEATFRELNEKINEYNKQYLWHSDSFSIQPKELPVPHFYGRTFYGENQEDEWFCVWILYELSQLHPGLVAHVRDSDGNILLIEAADALPDWLSNKMSLNRTFIHGGQMHLIPPEKSNGIIESTKHGVQLVRLFPKETTAHSKIQAIIDRRIDGYPARAKESWHHANLEVPPRLAVLLQSSNAHVLLASGIRALCDRDKQDVKACRLLPRFGVEPARNTRPCLVRLCFTRHLYAMLATQPFRPPKGLPWTELHGGVANELGRKLTFGCEIYLSRHAEAECRSTVTNGECSASSNQRSAHKTRTMSRERMLASEIDTNLKEMTDERIMEYLTELENNVDLRHTQSDDDSWMEVDAQVLDSQLESQCQLPNGKLVAPLQKFFGQLDPETEENEGFLDDFSEQKRMKKKQTETRKRGSDQLNVDGDSFEESMRKLLDLEKIRLSDGEKSSDTESYGEEDFDIDLDERASKNGNITVSLRDYMRAMDEQLEYSTMGKSFVKKPIAHNTKIVSNTTHSLSVNGNGHNANGAGASVNGLSKSPGADSIDFVDDDFTPIDIDRNFVQNVMSAYKAEQQNTGQTTCPAGALLLAANLSAEAGSHNEKEKQDDFLLDSDDELA